MFCDFFYCIFNFVHYFTHYYYCIFTKKEKSLPSSWRGKGEILTVISKCYLMVGFINYHRNCGCHCSAVDGQCSADGYDTVISISVGGELRIQKSEM